MPALTAPTHRLIYLDNAATTPLCEEAACAMEPFLACGMEGRFGNANYLHRGGGVMFVSF